MENIFTSEFKKLNLIQKGKVREIYSFDDSLLIVASDRISAFDVIMNETIPNKGKILNSISSFWFNKTQHIIANHFISNNIDHYPIICKEYSNELEGRSMLVKKCKVIPIECIVRGFVAGSGWKEYCKSKTICGLPLPDGLQEFSKIEEPVFTPSTKAEVGHDENISFDEIINLIGLETANLIKEKSIELYNYGYNYLIERGIILADTKFEFGINDKSEVILIDEAMTPDSSRFWLKEEYAPAKPQTNFDKQVLRDYLESIKWNKMPPPPQLPIEIINRTTEKYIEAQKRVLL